MTEISKQGTSSGNIPVSLSEEKASPTETVEGKLFNEKHCVLEGKTNFEVIVEQYKIFVESTEKVYEKRQSANSFFVTLNAGIFGVLGFLYGKDTDQSLRVVAWLFPIFGMVVSYYWARIISSYKQLNSGKFKIIDLIETRLPLALFSAEWLALAKGKNPDVYRPVTTLEIKMAWFFFFSYAVILLSFVPFKQIWLSLFGG